MLLYMPILPVTLRYAIAMPRRQFRRHADKMPAAESDARRCQRGAIIL